MDSKNKEIKIYGTLTAAYLLTVGFKFNRLPDIDERGDTQFHFVNTPGIKKAISDFHERKVTTGLFDLVATLRSIQGWVDTLEGYNND